MNLIYCIFRFGHNELAAHFIKGDVNQGGSNFSKFFYEALTMKGDPWNGTVREISAVKKADYQNRCFAPLHCACINPDTGPLKALFKVNPDLNISDSDQRKLIHYASACEDIGPLEFLLSMGANLIDTDRQGMTPLLIACKTGRIKTAEVIIQKCSKGVVEDSIIKKFGIGSVDRPGKDSWCPIHVAVAEQHPEIVSLLFKYGANPDKQLSSNYDKVNYLSRVTTNF